MSSGGEFTLEQFPEALAPAEIVAENFAGSLGAILERSFADPQSSLGDAELLLERVRAEVSSRALRSKLEDFVGVEDNPTERVRAYDAGLFHGVVALATALQQELRDPRTDSDEPGRHQTGAGQMCGLVAEALLNLDFGSTADALRRPTPDADGLAEPIAAAYIEGAQHSLVTIASTVRAQLERTVTRLFATPTQMDSEEDERIGLLLFVALTSAPRMTIGEALGSAFVDFVDDEIHAGHISELADYPANDLPLMITPSGGRWIRSRRAA